MYKDQHIIIGKKWFVKALQGEIIKFQNNENLVLLGALDDVKRLYKYINGMDLKLTMDFMNANRNLKYIVDSIFTKKESLVTIRDETVRHGAECGSDHKPVPAK